MSKLIELAVQRLEQLRSSGITVSGQHATAQVAPGKPTAQRTSKPALPSDPMPQATSKLIQLDAAAMKAAHVNVPGGEPCPQAEQFRMMKRPLIRNAATLKEQGQSRPNLIMVTSALAGEGKSFTATNLAMSIASEVDHSVLLVDADVARPSLSRLLGFRADAGLLDVLEGRATLPDVLLKTDIDKLTILPSGAPRARATELLASESMSSLLDEIATRYPDRIAIFDSPPLLLTTEASELAAHMGQIVVVVQADHTPQADVERAIGLIAEHPVRLMMLNRVHPKMMQGPGYGYGYGY
ncbi:MAG: Iron-sulfur cluster carrier protein [Burkholderiaceae bacterium]|nr:Iron-sulfur cluster carrier protein [Burkholderiaceae bacterium]